MGIYGGSDGARQAVTDPQADDFACYAALFAAADMYAAVRGRGDRAVPV